MGSTGKVEGAGGKAQSENASWVLENEYTWKRNRNDIHGGGHDVSRDPDHRLPWGSGRRLSWLDQR